MNIIDQIDSIDSLIVKHAEPQSVSSIRNQLSSVREQVEALLASYASLKNEHTVLKNTSSHEKEEADAKCAKAEEEAARSTKDYAALKMAQTIRGPQIIDNTTPGWNETLER